MSRPELVVRRMGRYWLPTEAGAHAAALVGWSCDRGEFPAVDSVAFARLVMKAINLGLTVRPDFTAVRTP